MTNTLSLSAFNIKLAVFSAVAASLLLSSFLFTAPFAPRAEAQTNDELQQLINNLLAQIALLQAQLDATLDTGDTVDQPRDQPQREFNGVSMNLIPGEYGEFEWGQQDAAVAEVHIDHIYDANITMDRVNLEFEYDGTYGDALPWETFNDVSLWVNGNRITEKISDDPSVWDSGEKGIKYPIIFELPDIPVDPQNGFEMLIAVSANPNRQGFEDWYLAIGDIQFWDGSQSIAAFGHESDQIRFSVINNTSVEADLVSEDTTSIENDDTTQSDNVGKFEIEFEVTAYTDDIYIPFGAAPGRDLESGFEFSILGLSSNVSTWDNIAYLVAAHDASTEETNTYKIREGETETFTLTVQLDPNTSGTYTLRLDTVNFALTDAVRATESLDVSSQGIDTASLTIPDGTVVNVPDHPGTLFIRSNQDNPSQHAIQVQDDDLTDDVLVFKFRLDGRQLLKDVVVTQLPIEIEVRNRAVVGDLIEDANLIVDGQTYPLIRVEEPNSNFSNLNFDLEGGIIIPSGTQEIVDVALTFKQQSGNYRDGQWLRLYVHGEDMKAYGSDHSTAANGTPVDVLGEKNSWSHRLFTAGVESTSGGDEITVDSNGKATYETEFELTAFGDDIYIPNIITVNQTDTETGFLTDIRRVSDRTRINDGSFATFVTSTNDEENGYFMIREGETETFTLFLEYDPGHTSEYYIQPLHVRFATSARQPNRVTVLQPGSEYKSVPVDVNGVVAQTSVLGASVTNADRAIASVLTTVTSVLNTLKSRI